MTGDPIVAYPQTETGSIGVVFGKPNAARAVREARDQQGLDRARAACRHRFGLHAAHAGGARHPQAGIDESYQDFVTKVAEARHRKFEEIDPVAQGRVWLGSQAKERGLVDELGGLETALAAVRKKANLAAGAPVSIVTYPARRSILDVLMQRSQEDLVEAKLAPVFGRVPFRAWLRGGFLRIAPQWLTVQ